MAAAKRRHLSPTEPARPGAPPPRAASLADAPRASGVHGLQRTIEASFVEPPVDRYPAAARLAILLGGGGLGWALVGAAAYGVSRLLH